MLGGPGVHKEFGWKPIGKYNFTVAANPLVIDPLPCNFERSVKMVSKWSYGGINLEVNNDAGVNYNYATHEHGLWLAAAVHAQATLVGGAFIKMSLHSFPNILMESIFQKMGDFLRVISHSFGYTDADNFTLTEVGGLYCAAGPYTRFEFSNSEAYNMTAQIEFFQSVFGF